MTPSAKIVEWLFERCDRHSGHGAARSLPALVTTVALTVHSEPAL